MSTITLPPGIIRLATIASYDSESKTASVFLDAVQGSGNIPQKVEIHSPHYSIGGAFIGGYLSAGTRVILSQGTGSRWYILSVLSSLDNDRSNYPSLNSGDVLVQANENTKFLLNSSTILTGSDSSYTKINTSLKSAIDNFNYKSNFTKASREIEGIVVRERSLNAFSTHSDTRLYDDKYQLETITKVSLDPNYSVNYTNSNSTAKNLPFSEKRELVYEFSYFDSGDAEVLDDFSESLKYSNSYTFKKSPNPNRRVSRTDVMSLSLAYPNFLMETIKGTAVDLYGNILDINKSLINLSNSSFAKKQSKADAFQELRALERRSIAYHFEINSRKDFKALGVAQLSDLIKDNLNYSRSKSRFGLDIDKEGQLKVNVPSSSETGNIPLLTRHDNYSEVVSNSEYANDLVFNKDFIDVLHNSFAFNGGSISIKDNDGDFGPKDRFTNKVIKHGTAYHDVVSSGSYFQSGYSYAGVLLDQNNQAVRLLVADIEKVKNIVSNEIIISGKNANAGGRSGLFNFDGSVEFNIGANTIDRQSLWLDTAGGIVANIGKDKNSISSMLSLDGYMYLQIGSTTEVKNDSRFKENPLDTNLAYNGKLDIRVQTKKGVALVRIDDDGINIISPGVLSMHSTGQMSITSDSSISISAEEVFINDRLVNKMPLTSI